jgi:hypothetical protein
MREKVAFQTNVPVTVALAYADGVHVEADSEIKSLHAGRRARHVRSSGVLNGCSAAIASGWITGDFHEKAGPCQAIFWVASTVHQTADQREAYLTFSLSFLRRFF